MLFECARAMGVRGLRWFPSAAFPCHAQLLPYLEDGTIRSIEGSLNGPLGDYASEGRMAGPAVLRSHGSRFRALQNGEVRVDIAVVAAPSADPFGNANGVEGPSACGSLGFALGDVQYADSVILVTDHVTPYPCVPAPIAGNRVDSVVVVERIGDSAQIVSGTTQVTRSPDRLRIASLAAEFVDQAGILREGFSFQAGAGGISLAFTLEIARRMRERQIRASFIRGGGCAPLVDLLEEGLAGALLDGQCFDTAAVRSMARHPRHVMTSPFTSYNRHGKGNTASMLDVVILGATEVDLAFNANVVSHSDGRLQHGIGGWQDALFGRCTILTLPTFRGRVVTIRDRVTTLCGPGELVDVVVTERGIAVNPRRLDLLDAISGADLPLVSLEALQAEAKRLCGPEDEVPPPEEPIGIVTWVDGSVLDWLGKVPEA